MSNKEVLKRLDTIDAKLDELLIATAKLVKNQYPPDNRSLQQPTIRPGDPSTYPTGPWPEGTVAAVKKGLS